MNKSPLLILCKHELQDFNGKLEIFKMLLLETRKKQHYS